MASQNKTSPGKRVARAGILVALAFIFSYVELMIPFSIGIPGVKLGLANLVVLSCLFLLPEPEVLAILIARIFLAGFLFGNLASIVYALAGGILSFLIMIFFKKIDHLSMVGISILGGVFHNIGQLIVAVLVVSNPNLFLYLPVLLIAGALSGALIGMVGKRCSGVLRSVL